MATKLKMRMLGAGLLAMAIIQMGCDFTVQAGSDGGDPLTDAGTSNSPDAGADADAGVSCPLATLEWLSIKNAVQDAVDETLDTTADSKSGISSAVNLLYGNDGFAMKWGWIDGTPCAAQQPRCYSDTSGTEPFFDVHDACSELTCESATVFLSRAYWTMKPIRLPSVGHPFSYALGSGAEVTYTPNPNVVWRVDKSDSSKTSVESSMLHNVVYTQTDGGTIDLTHTADVSASAPKSGLDAPATLTASLNFSRLRTEPISATVSLDAVKKPAGSVLAGAGAVVLGSFTSQPSGDNWHVTYTWTGVCER